MEELVVIILELLFVYPGAFIRWMLFYRKTKALKQVVSDDWFKNSYVGILVMGFVAGAIYTIVT